MALVQQHTTLDKQDNLSRGIRALEEAASHGASLVAYPELAFTSFLPQHRSTPESLQYAESIPGPTTRLFCQKAKEYGVVVVLNLLERDGDKTYDASPIIDSNGVIVGKNRMVHIIEAPCFHEQGYYS
ncbi:MAG: carbon-nitrogen hydrolase family protein, partial [Candidatus Bathyarchaeota archaeon]